MSDHVVPVRVYLAVFTALMVLTVVTVAISRVHLGALNAPVAMAIAVTKAVLVVLFFMHVKYSPRLTQFTIVGTLFFLVILFGTILDYAARGTVNPETRPAGVLQIGDQ
jgi:cytochrome c oxidase subunit 4